MTCTKHTPGPWTLSDDPVRRVIKGAGSKPRTICIIEDWTTTEDAKLIAAAPRLADKLEEALAMHELKCTDGDCILSREIRDVLRDAGRLP